MKEYDKWYSRNVRCIVTADVITKRACGTGGEDEESDSKCVGFEF